MKIEVFRSDKGDCLLLTTSDNAESARIGKQFEIGGSLAAYVLIAPSQPRWDPTLETSAGSDGRGTYADDTLTGAAIPVFVPSLRARYEL